jgi:hypothetical protein
LQGVFLRNFAIYLDSSSGPALPGNADDLERCSGKRPQKVLEARFDPVIMAASSKGASI